MNMVNDEPYHPFSNKNPQKNKQTYPAQNTQLYSAQTTNQPYLNKTKNTNPPFLPSHT